MNLTDNEAIWLWNVTDRYQPQNGRETDIVGSIRVKLRTKVEDIEKKRAEKRREEAEKAKLEAEAAEPCATGC